MAAASPSFTVSGFLAAGAGVSWQAIVSFLVLQFLRLKLLLSTMPSGWALRRMDIRAILNRKLGELSDGAHTTGLSAVKAHVDAAVRHLERGQSDPDPTLFTDAIYRCNQAFEGSIKEAYRVLTGKDPEKTSIHVIEQYLAKGGALRKKVLDQFTRYRQEWRNPSTHDYTLDFDEDEALLAIVSVTAFAIVLCDQIATKLAYIVTASAEPSAQLSVAETKAPLLELVSNRALAFVRTYADAGNRGRQPVHRASEFEGAFAGFLASEFSRDDEISVATGVELKGNSGGLFREADVVVTRGAEKVALDLKYSKVSGGRFQLTLAQTATLLHLPDISGALLVLYEGAEAEYEISKAIDFPDERVRVVGPKRYTLVSR